MTLPIDEMLLDIRFALEEYQLETTFDNFDKLTKGLSKVQYYCEDQLYPEQRDYPDLDSEYENQYDMQSVDQFDTTGEFND